MVFHFAARDDVQDYKLVESLVDVLGFSASMAARSLSRRATWAGWPGETEFTGDFEEYVAQKFPTSTAADFAVLQRCYGPAGSTRPTFKQLAPHFYDQHLHPPSR